MIRSYLLDDPARAEYLTCPEWVGRAVQATQASFSTRQPGLSWCAVYCSTGREFQARDGLKQLGIETFLPYESTTQRRKIAGRETFRIGTVVSPIYSGYLFARTDEFCKVENVGGVITVVKSRGCPLVIPEIVIAKLQEVADASGMVSSKDVSKLSYNFAGVVGDRFSFKRGSALHGLMGRISSIASLDDTGVITAWVRMLGSEREVEVTHQMVGAIAPKPNHRVSEAA